MTILTGENGAGKTNALEALAWSLSGTSPRTSSEARCIRSGSASLQLAATIDVGDGYEHTTCVTFAAARGKKLSVNGEVGLSVDTFSRAYPAVIFLPERLLAVRGAPARRRGMLDRFVQRVIPNSAKSMRAYTSALTQRNSILRRAKATGSLDAAALAPWTQLVCQHGEKVRADRAHAVQLLCCSYAQRLHEISGLEAGNIALQLRGGDIAAAVDELAAQEIRRGSTMAGPHLDDMLFKSGDRDLGTFGSTGEQRAALLAWALAEADSITGTAGATPVLLLDEPFAELDQQRRNALAQTLAQYSGQVIVTSTEPAQALGFAESQAMVFTVSSGSVSPWMNPTLR